MRRRRGAGRHAVRLRADGPRQDSDQRADGDDGEQPQGASFGPRQHRPEHGPEDRARQAPRQCPDRQPRDRAQGARPQHPERAADQRPIPEPVHPAEEPSIPAQARHPDDPEWDAADERGRQGIAIGGEGRADRCPDQSARGTAAEDRLHEAPEMRPLFDRCQVIEIGWDRPVSGLASFHVDPEWRRGIGSPPYSTPRKPCHRVKATTGRGPRIRDWPSIGSSRPESPGRAC